MNIQLLSTHALEVQFAKNTIVLEADAKHDSALFMTNSYGKEFKKTRMFTWPGEYEMADCLVRAFESDGRFTVFVVQVEDIHIVHLGKATAISPELIDFLRQVDILVFPFDEGGIEPKGAKKIIEKIDPRVLLPIGAKREAIFPLFGSAAESVPFYKTTRASLPQDKMEIIKLLEM